MLAQYFQTDQVPDQFCLIFFKILFYYSNALLITVMKRITGPQISAFNRKMSTFEPLVPWVVLLVKNRKPISLTHRFMKCGRTK